MSSVNVPADKDEHRDTTTLPSDVVRPTTVGEAPQQGATQPGSGSEVNMVTQPPPSFQEKVVGYAKEIRGTLLHKPNTKEHGHKILQGEVSARDPNVPRRPSMDESQQKQ